MNTTQRFLNAELERIERQLDHVDMVAGAEAFAPLVQELQRRYVLVEELQADAVSADVVIATLTEKLSEMELLLADMTASEHQHTPDPLLDMRTADFDYLGGLLERLQRTITDNVLVYQLSGVERL